MLLSVIPRICRYLTKKPWLLTQRQERTSVIQTACYLSRTHKCGGILPSGRDSTLSFTGGDAASVQNLFQKYGDKIACIVMEPYRQRVYSPKFYRELSDLCKRHRALLIFEETISGFRYFNPLAQKKVAALQT